MKYKKIFLDTCVLSDIGRMSDKDRNLLAYNFINSYGLQIILTWSNVLELENCPDVIVKNNIYNFLDICYVGIAKNFVRLFKEEFEQCTNKIDIIEYNLSILNYDINGYPMNFKSFKDGVLNSLYYIGNDEYDKVNKIVQATKEDFPNKEMHIDAILYNNIYKLMGKKVCKFDYNKIPGHYVYAYSFVNKLETKGLKKNANEVNDIRMSYLAPYMDIVVAERKQVARYNELKANKNFNGLNNVVIKKHSEVIIKNNEKVEFNI